MTQPLLDVIPEPAPLVSLLQREFSDEVLADLLQGGRIPADEVWEKALLTALRDFLSRPGKHFRARLVETSFRLAGGRQPMPETLPLIVEILHAGSLVVDDIEDGAGTRRGAPALHCEYGLPVALNAGNWLYFWAFSLVERLGGGPHLELSIYRWMSRTLLGCHHGQALDLTATMADLPQEQVNTVVAASTSLKTGGLLELSAALGALASGARGSVVAALAKFGRELGVGLQMLDDLSGLFNQERCHKGHEDLLNGRPTWPWAWLALKLPPAEYQELQSIAREVESRDLHPEHLALRMRTALGPEAKRIVRQHLQRSLAELKQHLGPNPEFCALSAEIRRLEVSYG